MEKLIRVGLGFAGGALALYGATTITVLLIWRVLAIILGAALAYYGLKGR